jgi:hypothetical protein
MMYKEPKAKKFLEDALDQPTMPLFFTPPSTSRRYAGTTVVACGGEPSMLVI